MPEILSTRRQTRALLVSQVVLIVGAVLRLIEYLANRPLSIDESFLALNLIEKSPTALLHELDFKQAAPLGFLELERLAAALFGKSEYALRAVPLLASLVALVFFYRAGKRLVPSFALPYACAAFAFLDPVIYYAATVKQYELDVTAVIGLYALATLALSSPIGASRFAKLAVFGAAAVWFSHASAFVLAAVGITIASSELLRRQWNQLLAMGLVAVVWLISFGLELYLSRSNLSRVQEAFDGGGQVFLGSSKAAGVSWFDSATAKLRYLVGLEDTATGFPILGSLPKLINQTLVLLICVVAAAGVVSLFRRRPQAGLLLATPPILVLIVSAFHKYPLVGRTLIFLLPAVALCLGEGIRVFLSGSRPRALAGGALGAVCLAAVALLPAIHVVRERASEGTRTALRELGRDAQPGDTLYVGQLAQYGVVYYHLCDCSPFDPAKLWSFDVTGGAAEAAPAMIPRTDRLVLGAVNLPQGNYGPDVRKVAGRHRVWILVSEIQQDKLEPFLDALRGEGRELREFGPFGGGTAASLYLFALSTGSSG